MHSTLNQKQTDDPHDILVVAPDVVLVAPADKELSNPAHDADALTGMLKAIDSGGPGSVYVMQVEDGADIAGMGGLIGIGGKQPSRLSPFSKARSTDGQITGSGWLR